MSSHPPPTASAASSSQEVVAMFGHHSLRPASSMCYLPRSAEMEAAKVGLRRALLATMAGNRSRVVRTDIEEALQMRYGLIADEFSIHSHCP